MKIFQNLTWKARAFAECSRNQSDLQKLGSRSVGLFLFQGQMEFAGSYMLYFSENILLSNVTGYIVSVA